MNEKNSIQNDQRRDAVRIFCDFDGTISTTDIGYDLFDKYGSQHPWHDDLLEKRINIRQYWRGVVKTLREPLTEDLLSDYLQTIPIDGGFGELVQLASQEGIPFSVVSDGLDIYIEKFLRLNGHSDLTLYCNAAVLNDDEEVVVSFPYAAEECECPSAVCKQNVVVSQTKPNERVIYIGDGLSDFCPSESADIIFAKGDLATYCNKNGLPHHSWKHLSEVTRGIRKILSGKRIRPRHRAELRRKQVWEQH